MKRRRKSSRRPTSVSLRSTTRTRIATDGTRSGLEPALKEVLIATEPMTAQIWKGSESLGTSPVSVSVPEGQSVELTIKADGYKDAHVFVDGSEPSQSIQLERSAGK